MTIDISLSPEVEARLRQRAAELGMDVVAYAANLIEQYARATTVEEILAERRKREEGGRG